MHLVRCRRDALRSLFNGLFRPGLSLAHSHYARYPTSYQHGNRRLASSNQAPKLPKAFHIEKIVEKLNTHAEYLAKLDEKLTPEAEETDFGVERSLREAMEAGDEPAFKIDPELAGKITEYSKTHWKRYKNLPTGWQNTWDKWDNLFTFYYPSPYYFYLIPQIDILVNIRHAIPGEARPIMFNNDLDAFLFEVVEARGSLPDLKAPNEEPRQLYYMDWKKEEIYKIVNASTAREVCRKMITQGGSSALELELLEPDRQGEVIMEQILDHNPTVIPILTEKLGYSPKPSSEFVDVLLDEAEEALQELGLEGLDTVADPKLQKEGKKAIGKIKQIIGKDAYPQSNVGPSELMEELQRIAPEEIPALLELIQTMKDVSPLHAQGVQEDFMEHLAKLEREVQEEGKVLGELLTQIKKQKSRES